MSRTIIVLSLMLLLAGCLTDSGERIPAPKAVSATGIDSISIRGRTVDFVVSCTVPELCWKFAYFESKPWGQTITTTVFARRTTAEACPQVISSIKAPVAITVPSSGKYTFCFWQKGGQTLDTTLTIQ